MADDKPKGVPPLTPKGKTKESLERGQRSNTGGDPYDRFRGNYSKNPPSKQEDEFGL